ncbi:hypothetical protein MFIFM68171_07548 [Madurella fahalii]|uniref:Zn(2)-C6 fungal-type domain-containing protein n=1 Tax=Madurella fahalii TaxID=1157608 RepID=A0ABQ0GHU9_9PEZI
MPSKRRVTETENPIDNAPGQSVAPASPAQPAPTKRQRVSRACDQCRAAREKCDGVQPQCFPCVSQRRPCTYEVSPKKRGVQTGYIRTLELALGWIFEKVSGSEDALNAVFAQQGGQAQIILAGKDAGGADRLQKRWRQSRVHKGIDRILSGGAAPSPCQDSSTSSVDVSDIEPDPARGCASSEAADAGVDILAQDPDPQRARPGYHRPHTPPNDGPPSLERRPERSQISVQQSSPFSPDRLRLPPNHWRLLDIYFSYTHSWLPILEKHALFQISYQYPEEGLTITPEVASSGAHAELWSALALASLQDAASSKAASSDDRDSVGPSPIEVYNVARGLLPSENGPFQVHHARALLLLSLVNLAGEKLSGAWLLTGSAIRILLDIPLPAGQPKDRRSMELALMACFMIETILSVRCNRPPHLREEDLADLPRIPEDGLDQWEPWKPCDGFGPSHAGPRSSRSPAFCMSTFNHLYAIMKVVAREKWAKRCEPSHLGRVATFVPQLQQAVDPNSPFGSFIASPDCGTILVPTAYVARAAYLWASAIVDPRSEAFLPRLQDTVNQYKKLFGGCSMPPFISACLASLVRETHQPGCRGQQGEGATGLISDYSSGWNKERRHPMISGSYQTEKSTATARSVHLFVPNNPAMTYPTHLISSPYNNSTITQHETNGGYGSFSPPGMAGPYSASLPQGSNNIQMHHGPGGMAKLARGPTALTSPIHHDHPPPGRLLPQAGFGRSPDYDALLDDLASIECTDPVDVDPQFMTNLGFAPGCDIAEILTRDFGGA